MSPTHGIQVFTWGLYRRNDHDSIEVDALGEAGSGLPGRSRLLDVLGPPSDIRGVVLLCGYIVAAAFGVFALLTPPGDPIGWAYIALAIVGYWFIPTRGLTTFLWLLVATAGAVVATSGSASGWVESGLGLGLALVALTRPKSRQPRAIDPFAQARSLDSAHVSNGTVDVATAVDSRVEGESRDQSIVVGERLLIRSIGQFQLVAGEADLTSGLEDKPKPAFLFKLLFARALLGRPEFKRDGLGDELYPRVPQSSQRERLRKQLYKLQHTTPAALGNLVRTSPTHVWLDLDDADSDVTELRRVNQKIKQGAPLIDSALATEVRNFLDQTQGTFLAGFEDLEQRVNRGGGTAGQVVAEAREQIDNQRADLVLALADYEDTMGRPAAAIPALEAALASLHRQDVARMLATAYLKTGQPARASEVRRRFELESGVTK